MTYELSEREFSAQVYDLCRLYGYRRYHTYRSKRSPAGFPDEVMVLGSRLIFAELKAETTRVTPEQAAWLEALGRAETVEAYLWRPNDLPKIARILGGRPA